MFRFWLMTFLVFVFLSALPTTNLLAMFEQQEEDVRSLSGAPKVRQTIAGPHYSTENLPDETLLIIFSSLNQKDIPSVTRTNRRWERLMNNNQLWKRYAERAFIIRKEDTSQERDYKALVKDHCIPSFTDLGTLNGGTISKAQGISFDGSVIVGEATDRAAKGQQRAFRWTRENGMESLGTLNGGTESSAQDINFDGSVIVGYANDGAAQNQLKAFRWTSGRGMESVEKLLTDKGLLPIDWILTQANAITPNGVVLVGEGQCKVQMKNREWKSLIRAWRAVIPRGNLF